MTLDPLRRLARNICLALLALTVLTGLLGLPAPSAAAEEGDARLTVGLPVYVGHPDSRSGNEGWNEGWFNNAGVFIDLSWPVYRLGAATNLRAGLTGGVFDNSIYNTSVFAGGMAEIETHATDRLSFAIGTYAGGITGYETSPAPALAAYVGTAYEVTERFELGLRGFWLPAKTIGGQELAESDAYVAAVTVGTRF